MKKERITAYREKYAQVSRVSFVSLARSDLHADNSVINIIIW